MNNNSFVKHQSNNFDFLRLVAASMVIVSHSFVLLNYPQLEPFTLLTGGQVDLGQFSVWVFFILSGYLITQSYVRSRTFLSYFVKRCLRIFPALILELLLAVFVWGALVTSLSSYSYYTNPATYLYLTNVFLYKITYSLPDVFTTNPYPNVVNGSLWTLPYEFLCYLGVAVVGVMGLFRKRGIFLIAYILFLIVGNFILNTRFYQATLPGTTFVFNNFYVLIAFFGAGGLFFIYQESIRYRKTVALAALLFLCIGFYFNIGIQVSFVTLPYLVLWFVFNPNIPLQKVGKFGDISYGIYIYGFPVQQTLIYFFLNRLNVASLIALSFLGTIPLAILSWKLVESPALNLKRKFVK